MISQKARYALRALIALARAPSDHSLMISEIASGQRIPRKFLEQILLELKRHGMAESKRGKHGGYRLQRRPEEISFAEVLRLMDGPLAPLPCLSGTAYRRCADCRDERECSIRRVLARSYRASLGVLERLTLADALPASGPPAAAEGRDRPVAA
jgi:Rrf2 family protein